MKRLLLFFTIFVHSLLSAEQAEDAIPRLGAEQEDYLTVANCVNVATGRFYQSGVDLEVGGPEPIQIARVYENDHPLAGTLGFGVGLNLPLEIKVVGKNRHKQLILELDNYEGATTYFLCESSDGEYCGSVSPTVYNSGYTSLRSSNHIKNCKVRFYGFDRHLSWGTFEVVDGDGTLSIYKSTSNGKRYLLNHQSKPSGNVVRYEYDRQERLIRVATFGVSEKTLMGEVTFKYSDDRVVVKGSNGSEAVYHLKKRKHYREHGRMSGSSTIPSLERIEGSGLSSTDFSYREGRFWHAELNSHPLYWKSIRLHEVINGDGLPLQVEYDGSGRVTRLFAPLEEGKQREWWSFTYHDDHTVVKDAYGYETIYHFNSNHQLTQLQRYEKKGPGKSLSSETRLMWDEEGKLLSRSIHDGKGTQLSAELLSYDLNGNVTHRRLVGDLTGDGGKDTQSTHYSYSQDGLNLLLSEQEEGGPLFLYEYKRGTNLVSRKRVYLEEVLVSEERFTRDEFGSVVEEVIEEFGEAPSTLVRTTKRSRELSCFGEPLSITTYFLDQETGALQQMEREELEYVNGLAVSRERFDSLDHLLFRTEAAYDDNHRVISRFDEGGRRFLYGYDNRGNLTTEELEGSGFRTLYSYDGMNRPIEKREVHEDGVEVVEQTRYDLCGRVIETIDRYGLTTRYSYDGLGRQTRVSHPARELAKGDFRRTETSQTFDSENRPLSITDELGYTTHYRYNARGEKTEVLYPDGSKEQFRYYPNGTLKTRQERNGSWTWHGYDPLKRIKAKETFSADDSFLHSSSYEYSGGKLIRSEEKGLETLYFYDSAGRLSERRCQERRTTFHYDTLGRERESRQWIDEEHYLATVEEKDFLQRTVEKRVEDEGGTLFSIQTSEYDLLDNAIRSFDGVATVETTYNSRSEPVILRDAAEHETHTSYDHNNQDKFGQRCLRKTTVDPLGRELIELFNSIGQVTSIEKRSESGERLAYEERFYSRGGELLSQRHFVYFEGELVDEYQTSWQRDGMDRPLTMETKGRTTSYAYDRRGQLLRTTKPDGVTVTRSYDPEGRLASQRSSDGSIFDRFTYGESGEVLSAIDKEHNLTLRSYNDHNELIEERLANGLTVGYRYDTIGRLIQVALPDDRAIDYSYSGPYLATVSLNGEIVYEVDERDSRGLILAETLARNAGSIDRSYDGMGRILSLTHAHYQFSLPDGYDSVGNLHRIQVSDPAGEQDSHYDYTALNQLKKADDESFAYDSLDNRRKKNETNLTLDTHNQLLADEELSFRYDDNGNLIQYGEKVCEYDALNRLIRVTMADGEVVAFQYDPFGRRLSKGNERYLYLRKNEIGAVSSSGALIQLRIDADYPVAIELYGKLYATLEDYRRCPALLLDSASGKPAATHRYTAFGEELLSPTLSPWGFSGKRLDRETGWIYFGARYYLPKQGRWLTPDPIGFADGPNLYAYVHNRPLTSVDPTGLATFTFGRRIQPKRGGHYFVHPNTERPTSTKMEKFLRTGPIGLGAALWLSGDISSGIIYGDGDNKSVLGIVVNGWANTVEDVYQMAEEQSRLLGGADCIWVYNPHLGLYGNSIEALMLNTKYGKNFKVPKLIARIIRDTVTLKNYDEIYAVGHSEGGAMLKQALANLQEYCLEKVHARTYGTALIIDDELLASYKNYVSKLDLVPHILNSEVRNNTASVVSYVDHPEETVLNSHTFFGPSYSRTREIDSEKFTTKRRY